MFIQEGDASEQSLTVNPPREYTAPELTRPGMGKPTVGADMYSFGALSKRMLNVPADLWE